MLYDKLHNKGGPKGAADVLGMEGNMQRPDGRPIRASGPHFLLEILQTPKKSRRWRVAEMRRRHGVGRR
eukprot:scaffold120697_cov33-Cyclotella_meneghiniana.AAC.2